MSRLWDSRHVGSVVDACCSSGDPRLGGAGARDTRGRDSRVVCVDMCRGSEDPHRGDPGRGLCDMYHGDPRGGSGDMGDQCRGLLRGLPLAVSRRVGDPARDTLRPERSREAVTCRVTGLREVITTALNCLYHAARPLGNCLSIRGKRHCTSKLTTRLTHACAV